MIGWGILLESITLFHCSMIGLLYKRSKPIYLSYRDPLTVGSGLEDEWEEVGLWKNSEREDPFSNERETLNASILFL